MFEGNRLWRFLENSVLSTVLNSSHTLYKVWVPQKHLVRYADHHTCTLADMKSCRCAHLHTCRCAIRSVGKQVEEFVGQILTEKFPNKKFDAKPVHKGADFEILELEVTQGDRKLWIEVKSTRNERDSQEVKMSSEQAKKAVKEKENFLLCVVPLPESIETDLETVRENMRFIANIGDRVSQLYDDIDFLEAVREYITEDLTAETTADVRLTVDSGEISILIKNSVWEKNGFPLDELVEHLIRTNNALVT